MRLTEYTLSDSYIAAAYLRLSPVESGELPLVSRQAKEHLQTPSH